MRSENEAVGHARKSCLPCRRSKRRCDRKVPRCDLCIRKEVDCSYPPRRETNQALLTAQGWTPDTISLGSSSHNCEQSPSSILPSLAPSHGIESNANAIYFIAPHTFQQARLELPRPTIPIPTEVSSLIGDASSIKSIANAFFTKFHRWLPIVFKQGFFAYLLNPLARRWTELSLLALCMKLCCTAPSDEDGNGGGKTSIYHIAKQFQHAVETAGFMSIYVLQAGVFIASYELGQAIYPAAYITVGVCARYGLALGINKFSPALVGAGNGPRSWHEVEERRRVWWAVLILDRFLSLSNPSRPLSTEDPSFDTYLPVDDGVWNDWRAEPGDAVRISTGFTLKMGGFARLAQATYLLSQALRSLQPTATEGDVTLHDQTAQLRCTLLALVHAVDSEATFRRLEYCTPSAVSLSTILLLQEHYLQEGYAGTENEHTGLSVETLWNETRTALDRLLSSAISYIATYHNIPDSSDGIPVFVIHVTYQVACLYLRLAPEMTDEEDRDKIEPFRRLLRLIDSRWRLAGVYLKILEARQITKSSDAFVTQ